LLVAAIHFYVYPLPAIVGALIKETGMKAH
jgi:hypothetical protein